MSPSATASSTSPTPTTTRSRGSPSDRWKRAPSSATGGPGACASPAAWRSPTTCSTSPTPTTTASCAATQRRAPSKRSGWRASSRLGENERHIVLRRAAGGVPARLLHDLFDDLFDRPALLQKRPHQAVSPVLVARRVAHLVQPVRVDRQPVPGRERDGGARGGPETDAVRQERGGRAELARLRSRPPDHGGRGAVGGA